MTTRSDLTRCHVIWLNFPMNHTTTNSELAQVIGYIRGRKTTTPDIEGVAFTAEAPELGQIAWIYGRGGYRRGIVVKVTATKATIEYLTLGGIDAAERRQTKYRHITEEATHAEHVKFAGRTWDYCAEEMGPNARHTAVRSADDTSAYKAVVAEGRAAYSERIATRRTAEIMSTAERITSSSVEDLATRTKSTGTWTTGEVGR